MLVGANKMQSAVQIPTALVTVLNGLVVVFVVASELWRRQIAKRQEMTAMASSPDFAVEEAARA